MARAATDPILWDDWHAVADVAALRPGRGLRTRLLDVELQIAPTDVGATVVRTDGEPLHARLRYGFAWACLGEPARDIVAIPEAAEDDRCVTTGGSFGVHVSAPRMVENFLDLGHLGYVHEGYLGAEPHTEVLSYTVSALPEGGIAATGCKIYQPVASPAAKTGYVVDYVYKVVRPLTTCLYKANPLQPHRFDVIYLFAQPVDEEHSIGHALLLFLAEGTEAKALRRFQQLIFLQDKPILENQFPKKLPLGPRMEMPIRADKSSVAYRRWLNEIGLRYAVIAE